MTRYAALLLPAVFAAAAGAQPAASIRGRIVDDLTREPLPRARLVLAGKPLAEPQVSNTDNQGEFTFTALPPGIYTIQIEKAGSLTRTIDDIAVSQGAAATLGDLALSRNRSISGVFRAPAASNSPANIFVLPVRAHKLRTRLDVIASVTPGERFRLTGLPPACVVLYALTRISSTEASVYSFYPGGDTPDLSACLDLTQTPEFDNVSITLEPRPTVSIDGVISATPSIPAGTPVALALSIPGHPYGISATTRIAEPFRFDAVAPGSYRLRILPRTLPGAQPQPLALYDLQVTTPIQGLVIAPSEPPTIAGTISPASPVTLPVEITIGGIFAETTLVTPDANGDFRIAIAPGDTARLLPPTLPPGTYIANPEIHLTPESRPIRILLRKGGGRIAGTTTPQAFLVLAPKSREATHLFRTATAGWDGAYQIAAIAPGEYDLFTLDHNENDAYLDPAYLSHYAESAEHLTVTESSPRN